jgi:two-component system chemotaxis sensor kinase CheA
MYHRSINELFRVFHNIKSASGYLKLTSMFRLASLVEDELDVLRNMDEPINEETSNWLFAISDMFAQWQEDFSLDNKLSKVKYSLLKIPDLEK